MEKEPELYRKAGICPSCGKRNHALARDDVKGTPCDDCLKNIMATSSKVICNGCNRIAAFVGPGITPDGFEFSLNQTYHCTSCPQCNPSNPNVPILELSAYLQEKGLDNADDTRKQF